MKKKEWQRLDKNSIPVQFYNKSLATRMAKLSRGNGNLSSEENSAFFKIVGDKCQSLCTTIAQVLESDSAGRWIKLNTGLLCFIKDNGRRSYYMQMYCLKVHKMVWQQEIYNELIIDKLRPFLLGFEGQVRKLFTMIRLNNLFLMMERKQKI